MSQLPQSSSAAAMEWPRPLHRDPTTLRPEQVCPHCKRKTVEHRFATDGHPIIAHHCPEHREVVPMRSVIVRDHRAEVVS
jgi:hypothetical protein